MHRHNVEIDQIRPGRDPWLQRLSIRCFHDLKTTAILGIDPTGNVDDAFRKHSAVMSEPVANSIEVAMFGALDDHEEHHGHCTPASANGHAVVRMSPQSTGRQP